MKPKTFITGGTGLLGSTLLEVLKNADVPFSAPEGDFNITRPSDIHNHLVAGDNEYDVVIHCAAMVNVDRCEASPGLAYDVNTKGTALIAEACRYTGTPMIYLSTDYVFSGKKDLIPEWEDKNPVNVYGMSKSCAEEIVEYFLPGKHAIIRTAGLYGKQPKGYIHYVLDSMLNGDFESLFRAPVHRTFQPTSAEQLAILIVETAASLCMGEMDAGIYHGTCSGAATHMDVAKHIANYINAHGYREEGEIRVICDSSWVDKTNRPTTSLLGKDAWADTNVNQLVDWRVALHHDLPTLIENMKGNKSNG